MNNLTLFPIIIPLAAAVLVLIIRRRFEGFRAFIAAAAALLNLAVVIAAVRQELTCSFRWAGFGMDFVLRLYPFSAFI
ncbi:NADH-quinone oxidoreductase subunit L, partial [bacterium]